MASQKLSRSHATGYDPHEEIRGPFRFTLLCRERLGVSIPVGGVMRGRWYEQLGKEMKIQGWTWQDLVHTVDYIAENNLRCRKIFGVLFYVDEAIEDRERRAALRSSSDLHVKVAEAIATETDEYWRRRLSLAQGKILERVYKEWTERNG